MPVCRYRKKNVPISCYSSHSLESIDSEHFVVIWLKSGSLRCLINGTSCYLNGGSLICLSKGSRFTVIHKYNISVCVLSFAPSFVNVNLNWNVIHSREYAELRQIHDYPDFTLFLAPLPQEEAPYCGVLPLAEDMEDKLTVLFTNIENQLQTQPDQRWSCRSRSWLFELLNLLQYEYEAMMSCADENDLITKVCGYIAAHLNEDITIALLSRLYMVNHTTLTSKFRQRTGKSINVYINEKRLEIVKHQLAFTELSLKEIASMNGYGSSPYLVRVFKSRMMMTPLEYRKKMRSGRTVCMSR